MAGSDDKTEKATPKKRQDERKKGNIFSSKDIASVASILVIFSMLKFMFSDIAAKLMAETKKYFAMAGTTDQLSVAFLHELSVNIATSFAVIAAPILIAAIIVGVLAIGIQTKFNFSNESMMPKFSRLNPLQGIKRMFSLKSMIEVVKNLLKVFAIGYIVYDFLVKRIAQVAKAFFADLNDTIVFLLNSVMQLIYSICLIFIFIAGLDYLYQKWDYERQIKMSKHDVKEEYKQIEGDPQVKGKIKEKQRQISLSRMMQAVPTADVVIRNPDHFAVALKYDIEKDNAPVVVAKGQDELALRIVKVAEENNVKTIENKPLARAIYAASELNQEIPMEHYTAVAEILALIYGSKK